MVINAPFINMAALLTFAGVPMFQVQEWSGQLSLPNSQEHIGRADAKNKQLQRVYGVAFPTKKELDDYLKMIEEAEKRDHRKLGKELELFSIHEEGPGFPFFLPKGMIIKNELIKFWREEHRIAGYVEVQTPIMLQQVSLGDK